MNDIFKATINNYFITNLKLYIELITTWNASLVIANWGN